MPLFGEPGIYSNRQLDISISEECGSSDRTLRDIKKQMRTLGLLTSVGLGLWKIDRSHNRAEEGYGEKQKQLGTSDRLPSARIPPATSAKLWQSETDS